MKQTFFFLVLALSLNSCDHKTGEQATNGQDTTSVTQYFYGSEFDLTNAIAASEIPAKLATADSMEVILTGNIVETCSKAGCWMTVDIGQAEPMWVYTNHEFFVPTEGCKGLVTGIKGIAKKEVQDVAFQKHLAEDAKKSPEEIAAITTDKTVYSVVAKGIMIEGYQPEEGEEGHDHDHDHDHNHDHDGDGKPDHSAEEHTEQ
jgi:Domain of unknown function (DUF4920)